MTAPSLEACTCNHGIRPLGMLHGVNMGKGRVRLGTTPDCPVHGTCAACGQTERRCYDKRWAKGFDKMLAPCCDGCSHLTNTRAALVPGHDHEGGK